MARCVVCKRKLKVFEFKLCSCGKDVCMLHKEKTQHDCSSSKDINLEKITSCLLYTSPSPRDGLLSRMPSSA